MRAHKRRTQNYAITKIKHSLARARVFHTMWRRAQSRYVYEMRKNSKKRLATRAARVEEPTAHNSSHTHTHSLRFSIVLGDSAITVDHQPWTYVHCACLCIRDWLSAENHFSLAVIKYFSESICEPCPSSKFSRSPSNLSSFLVGPAVGRVLK